MTGLAPPAQTLVDTTVARRSPTGASASDGTAATGGADGSSMPAGPDGGGASRRRRVSDAAIGSTCVPNGYRARSRPEPSTRKMSAVWAMPYAPEPGSASSFAYFTDQASAVRRTESGAPVSPVNASGR